MWLGIPFPGAIPLGDALSQPYDVDQTKKQIPGVPKTTFIKIG